MVRLLGFFVPRLACVICLICVYCIQQRGKASRTKRSTSCREPQANSASSTTVEKSSSRASGKRTKPLTVLPDSSLATSSCGKLRMATTFARYTSCRARRALRLSSSFLMVRRKASSTDQNRQTQKNAPPTAVGKWGIFRGRISRRSILSNINTLVARIDLPRGAAEISNYVEFYTIRAVSDPIPQAINSE